MKIIFTWGMIFLMLTTSYGQVPGIYSVEPEYGYVNDTIIISGVNFGTVVGDIQVFFGAAEGSVLSVNDNAMRVVVPGGATYGYISVTNLSNNLTAYSPEPFLISYGGSSFDVSDLDPEIFYASDLELNDVCMCDFDLDGLNDVIGANNNSGFITVLRNTSAGGAISYNRTTINLNTPTYNTVCGDIDGDGRPDLIFSKSGTLTDRVLVLRNTSTVGNISFAASQAFVITASNARNVAINDLNNDGKPELIITNETNNRISILVNESTPGSIAFNSTLQTITADGASSTNGLDIADLNNDGYVDIVVSATLGPDVYYFLNTSSTTTVSFDASRPINVTGNIVNIKVGDLDGDGLADIAGTQLVSDEVSVLLNTTTDFSNIQFSAPVDFQAPLTPWGLDFGDMNGDGQTDILVGSIDDSHVLGVLINNSIIGAPSFSYNEFNTSDNNRNIKAGDVSGDGKPDIVYTSINTNNITIVRNGNCMEALLVPGQDQVICSGQSTMLSGPYGIGAAYSWTRSGTPIPDNTSSIIVSTAGDYQLTITSEGGSCVETSPVVNISVQAGTIPATPVIGSNSPVCSGETLDLTATSTNALSYNWNGPAGYSSNTQNPQIPDIQLGQAGYYTVRGVNGSCFSDPASVLITLNESSRAVIFTSDPTEICSGNSSILESVIVSGASYQWQRNGSDISGATNPTINANVSGTYTMELTNGLGCVSVSNPIVIQVVSLPVANFTIPSTGCVGDSIIFNNTSTVDPVATVFYQWNFGDGNSSGDQNPRHAYVSSSSYNVSLTVEYSDNTCSSTTQQTIPVNDPVQVNITVDGTTDICPGDNVPLSAGTGFVSYLWSTGETTEEIIASDSIYYKVETEDASGCNSSDSVRITFLPVDEITITADETVINRRDTTQLFASGGVNYIWNTSVGLSDSTIYNPLAFPEVTSAFIVFGEGTNGCYGTDTVTITVNQEDITRLDIDAPKVFTPNGDGIDDIWIIQRIENYPECRILIFNRQGNTLFEDQPYQNNWDAVYQGKELAEDVYYYVIRCGQSNKNIHTGSITVVR